MRFTLFSVMAALATQALAEDPGQFTIRATGSSLTLTDLPNEPLSFLPLAHQGDQRWMIGESFDYIQNVETGRFVNCPTPNIPCVDGKQPQKFRHESAGDGRFLLAQPDSPFYLRRTENNQLELAEMSGEGDFVFEIIPVSCESKEFCWSLYMD